MSVPNGSSVDQAVPRPVCAIHGPDCLALIRAGDRPDHLLDFLDRQVKMLGSGHWSIKTTLNLLALIGGIAACVVLLAAVPLSRIAQVAGERPMHALVAGGLGVSGASAAYCVRKYRARRNQAVRE
ncbi:hypothetical protein BJY24_004273 [Nocardia transvalensis]|uniref:Uncharacterized protein n=1 Tax=Nocardia transvalensis TaxID=37333 RepID=A0A7W9UJH3_9NOCA|nr:hypothetical protein [Nocardia transvalensis]MBB5915361.1 hypothetical protein [Nocardia transvalensis]